MLVTVPAATPTLVITGAESAVIPLFWDVAAEEKVPVMEFNL